MNAEKDVSIEYAHIYTNNKIGEEHELSLGILSTLYKQEEDKEHTISLVVLIDDYAFPDSSFDYVSFSNWLQEMGFMPDVMLRESQLVSLAEEVRWLIKDDELRGKVSDFIRTKKYPCSLLTATWYLLRLGYLSSPLFDARFISRTLINILPLDFKPYEEKALEIIRLTKFAQAANQIQYKYFEGRMVA
jgi:hypothetical protein